MSTIDLYFYVIKDLLKMNAAESVCAKVFTSGSILYSCQECANDPTCVLCAECFNHSIHKDHDYTVS